MTETPSLLLQLLVLSLAMRFSYPIALWRSTPKPPEHQKVWDLSEDTIVLDLEGQNLGSASLVHGGIRIKPEPDLKSIVHFQAINYTKKRLSGTITVKPKGALELRYQCGDDDEKRERDLWAVKDLVKLYLLPEPEPKIQPQLPVPVSNSLSDWGYKLISFCSPPKSYFLENELEQQRQSPLPALHTVNAFQCLTHQKKLPFVQRPLTPLNLGPVKSLLSSPHSSSIALAA